MSSGKLNFHLKSSDLLFKVCKFMVNECILGDYYEFGVYRGEFFYSFVRSYFTTAKKRLDNSNIIGSNSSADLLRRRQLSEINFHAFDSFRGLPMLTLELGATA